MFGGWYSLAATTRCQVVCLLGNGDYPDACVCDSQQSMGVHLASLITILKISCDAYEPKTLASRQLEFSALLHLQYSLVTGSHIPEDKHLLCKHVLHI